MYITQHRQSVAQISAIHRDHLQRRLQQRVATAEAQGNQELLRQLAAEAKVLKL
jgi:hypothetical protein